MSEWLASILDKFSIIAPGKYFGLGLSLLSVGILWLASEAPYSNFVAVGTALISLGAFAQSLGAPKAMVLVVSCWTVFFTAPAFARIVSGLFARNTAYDCVATEHLKSNADVDRCTDGINKWLSGD